ncbi:signal peptidase I [Neobacillus soli]|nr:signal peptidase I [Neobacillus soli]
MLLKSVILKDGWLELPSMGNSMFPFIQQGNICRFAPFELSIIKKGDIILFHTPNGQLIAHRYYKKERMENKVQFFCKGDANLGFDQPIEYNQILGKLISVQKGRKKVSPDDQVSHLWGKMIIVFPALSFILRKYLNRNIHLQY